MKPIKIRFAVSHNKSEEIIGVPLAISLLEEKAFLGVKHKEGIRYIPVDNIISMDSKRALTKASWHEWSSDEGMFG